MNPVMKIIIAVTIWGSVGLFVKNISLPALEIVFLRALVGSVFLLIFNYMKNKSEGGGRWGGYKKENKISIIIAGLLMPLNWLCLFQAYKYTTVANATLSYYAAPVFVVLLSPIIVKEKLTLRKLLSVFIAMGGLSLITFNQPMGDGVAYSHGKGIIFGLMGAVFFASVILLSKRTEEFTSFDKTAIEMYICTMVLLPIVLFRGNLNAIDLKMVINFLILGVVHTGIAFNLFFSSMEELTSQRVSILSYIEPVSAVVFGTIFLGEPLNIYHIFGGALVLLSTFEREAKESNNIVENNRNL